MYLKPECIKGKNPNSWKALIALLSSWHQSFISVGRNPVTLDSFIETNKQTNKRPKKHTTRKKIKKKKKICQKKSLRSKVIKHSFDKQQWFIACRNLKGIQGHRGRKTASKETEWEGKEKHLIIIRNVFAAGAQNQGLNYLSPWKICPFSQQNIYSPGGFVGLSRVKSCICKAKLPQNFPGEKITLLLASCTYFTTYQYSCDVKVAAMLCSTGASIC